MLFNFIFPLTGLLFLATNVASVPSQPRASVTVRTHAAGDKPLNIESHSAGHLSLAVPEPHALSSQTGTESDRREYARNVEHSLADQVADSHRSAAYAHHNAAINHYNAAIEHHNAFLHHAQNGNFEAAAASMKAFLAHGEAIHHHNALSQHQEHLSLKPGQIHNEAHAAARIAAADESAHEAVMSGRVARKSDKHARKSGKQFVY
ncbi:hypothetical protein HYPSUDRAFT_47013 [Hypholoma sublateritium FD-334 SS-4]|uniref:DUF1771 domain-containing protein n=1 Tax=Hypholoma sublateritium (strain FD-334 SS-4) TaxID=945553 RepID=A0A0D2M0L7_HYPSF|nr:hypothetical protein HYPSUDRAFT_47013 [Hypholoma sublateritium FD-334 SS-4]